MGLGILKAQDPWPGFERVFAPLFAKSGLSLIKLKHSLKKDSPTQIRHCEAA
jgi:hypothetical protein